MSFSTNHRYLELRLELVWLELTSDVTEVEVDDIVTSSVKFESISGKKVEINYLILQRNVPQPLYSKRLVRTVEQRLFVLGYYRRYRRRKIDCSSFFTVPATSAAQNSLLFFFFLLRQLTKLIFITRQAVRAVKQSIFLRCLWVSPTFLFSM